MDNATYLQTNLIPAVTLVILYFNSRAKLPFSRPNRLLRALIVLILSLLVTDTAAMLLNGTPGPAARRGLMLANCLYFLFSAAIAFCWFLYVSSRLWEEVFPPQHWPLLAPLLLYLLLVFGTPSYGFIFTLDENNVYRRGPWFYLQYALAVFYLVLGSALALRQMRRLNDPEERREYRNIALFTVFPLAGATLQVVFFGLAALMPLTAAALLLTYITIQRSQIALDGLTGLNNRGRLDEYLRERCSHTRPGRAWYLMLVDLDDFKQINDVYGHVAGDQALRQAAQLLKRTFGRSGAFLARYGGDEFAAVLPWGQEARVLEAVRQLNAAAHHAHWETACPVALSVGYARFDGAPGDDAVRLIARADEEMYRVKRARKAASPGR